MAKLCSYYPLHFMRAVIIVNPRGLLYHVRGSREGDGVGWCMANWKCHSYLFISDTRPLYTHARGRTHTRRCAYTCRSAHTHMYIRTRKQVHPHTHTHTQSYICTCLDPGIYCKHIFTQNPHPPPT